MSPEDIERQTIETIASAQSLVDESVNRAIEAATAFQTGHFGEYWANVYREAQARMNEQYQRARTTEEAEAPEMGGDAVPPPG